VDSRTEREAGEPRIRAAAAVCTTRTSVKPPAYVLVAETTRSTPAARPGYVAEDRHDGTGSRPGQETARLVPAAEIVASGPVPPPRTSLVARYRRRRQETVRCGAATCHRDPGRPLPYPYGNRFVVSVNKPVRTRGDRGGLGRHRVPTGTRPGAAGLRERR